MNIAYVAPLRLAWQRMLRMLFRPFAAGTWFVLGFAAFLSEYLSWGYGGSRFHYDKPHGHFARKVLLHVIEFMQNPFAVALMLWIVLAALVAMVLVMWVSSRGMFIWLDNVAHERRGIVEPWKRFARLGNSLFLWRLGLSLVALLVIGAMLVPYLAGIAALARSDEFDMVQFMALIPMICMIAVFALFFSYVVLFMHSFVVPIMARYDLTAGAAWSRFMGLFGKHPWQFLLYGVFVFLLGIGVACGVLMFGFATCCVGFILIGFPYIGSVVLLPIEVTGRAFGPEFLVQFDPDLRVLAPPAAPVAPVAAAGPVA